MTTVFAVITVRKVATTAAPCFLTSGRTVSKRSSSPVTEFTRALP